MQRNVDRVCILKEVYPDQTSQKWLEHIKDERVADGRLLLDSEQFLMVEKVAHRVRRELDAEGDGNVDPGEP